MQKGVQPRDAGFKSKLKKLRKKLWRNILTQQELAPPNRAMARGKKQRTVIV